MSKFTDFIDSIQDVAGTLAKKELKDLIKTAKKDESDFVRCQAQNLERWTVMLTDGDLTVKGYKRLVKKMEVLPYPHLHSIFCSNDSISSLARK